MPKQLLIFHGCANIHFLITPLSQTQTTFGTLPLILQEEIAKIIYVCIAYLPPKDIAF